MSKRKLLLADDSVTIQKVINLTFADEGIEVVTCGDGDTALEKIASESPDIVMADVHMPGANGYSICETIRADPETAALPVILLVGSFEPFDENEAIRVRASSVMTKPFSSIRELVNQVMELMNAAGSGDEISADPQADIPTVIPNAEMPSETAQAEVDDIESLYQQSLNNEPRPEDPSAETVEFGDVGMDDELVEESRPNIPDHDILDADTAEYTFADETGEPDPYESGTETSAGHETPVSSEAADGEHDTLELPKPVLDKQTSQADMVPEHFSAQEEINTPAEPELPASLPELGIAEEMEAEETEYDFSDLPTDEPVNQEHTGYETADLSDGPIDTTAAENALPKIEPDLETGPIELDESLSQARYEFDEIDLLDIPQVGDDSSFQLVTPEQSIASDSLTKVVSLSPELIDMIVERVVERLKRES